jgi:hypothetical protein
MGQKLVIRKIIPCFHAENDTGAHIVDKGEVKKRVWSNFRVHYDLHNT